LFAYLIDNKENANKPLREIAMNTGLSLGTVQGKMAELSLRGYIVESNGRKVLRNRTRLIDRWAREYSDDNKQKQFVMRFRFLSPSIKENWQEINLGTNAFWGGEPGAFLLDGYLQPERWDIYVEEKADSLIKTAKMIPDPNGEIYVYRKFWNRDGIPPLVIYADLFVTGDDRCREAAIRLKEKI